MSGRAQASKIARSKTSYRAGCGALRPPKYTERKLGRPPQSFDVSRNARTVDFASVSVTHLKA